MGRCFDCDHPLCGECLEARTPIRRQKEATAILESLVGLEREEIPTELLGKAAVCCQCGSQDYLWRGWIWPRMGEGERAAIKRRIKTVDERRRQAMLHKLIDQKVLAEYLRVNQVLIEEIVRDQKDQDEKQRLASAGDQMLTAKEAAATLACSEDWLYRNAKKLPFAKKLGPKNLRFSRRGLEKWLSNKQPHC